jgi:hypothetical protein
MNRKYRFSDRVSKIIVPIALLSVALVIILTANNYSLNLEYKPYNGSFQTFNPIRRILTGKLPGRDFNPYLGLGTTYFTTALCYLFGGNFAASQFSNYLISLSLHLLVLLTLFFLAGLILKKSIIVSSFILISVSFDLPRLFPLWEIIAPGNSNLGLRSSLPFLTTLAIICGWRLHGKNRQIFYGFIGCLIGIQPLWSNDYGIPSFLTLSSIAIIYLLRQESRKKIAKAIGLISIAAFISFFASAYCLTGGHPIDWLKDNFTGVAAEQFWYFLAYNGKNKIFTIDDLFFHPFLYLYLISLILLAGYIFWKEFNLRYLLLLYVSATVFEAGILASVGGTISIRYYFASLIVLPVIFPLAVYLWVKQICGDSWLKKIQIRKQLKQLPIVLLIFYLTAPIVYAIACQIYWPNPSAKNGFFWVAELGGWLPNKWQHSIEIGRKINSELKNRSPERRILSTYSSGIDVVAGAFNPTGIDYIIHALGDPARKQYLDRFRDLQPKYITTLREDYIGWETWVRRTNWWFYREFALNYQPVDGTFYNIIWQRLERPRSIDESNLICRIDRENNSKVNLIIETEAKQQDDRIYYLDIGLKYHLEVEPSGMPIIGKRGLVNATETQTALKRVIGEGKNRSYGMPPNSDKWHVPIEHQLGKESILAINSYPEDRTKLQIESCQAKLFSPVDYFTFDRHLITANFNNNNWQNGISLVKPEIMITNSAILDELYSGMTIQFAKSGKRQILAIQGNTIKVDGTILDPLADGYPHPINARLR